MEEKVELANLLFELDKGEHTIPYEAWAEQILDAGWSKYLPSSIQEALNSGDGVYRP